MSGVILDYFNSRIMLVLRGFELKSITQFMFGLKMKSEVLLLRGICRVATVGAKYLENKIFSRSGKSQGILCMAREI